MIIASPQSTSIHFPSLVASQRAAEQTTGLLDRSRSTEGANVNSKVNSNVSMVYPLVNYWFDNYDWYDNNMIRVYIGIYHYGVLLVYIGYAS